METYEVPWCFLKLQSLSSNEVKTSYRWNVLWPAESAVLALNNHFSKLFTVPWYFQFTVHPMTKWWRRHIRWLEIVLVCSPNEFERILGNVIETQRSLQWSGIQSVMEMWSPRFDDWLHYSKFVRRYWWTLKSSHRVSIKIVRKLSKHIVKV